MQAYECEGILASDGHIAIPKDVRKKLSINQSMKLVILIEDHFQKIELLNAIKELNGLIADESAENIEKFDRVINERNYTNDNPRFYPRNKFYS